MPFPPFLLFQSSLPSRIGLNKTTLSAMRHLRDCCLLLFFGGGQTLLWPWWRSLPGERFPWHRWVRMSAAPRWGACWSGPRPRARRRRRRSARGRPRPWHGRGSDNGFAIHIEQYRDKWQTEVARRILPTPRFQLSYYVASKCLLAEMTFCSGRVIYHYH